MLQRQASLNPLEGMLAKKRSSLSKRTRFTIFERDSFTCQYCGNRPPDVTLQLDHIHPFSEGGEDTEENLTTSCMDCNAGKSNRVLGAVIPRPDADVQFLHAQQEISETRRYLESKQERDDLYRAVVAELGAVWARCAPRYYPKPEDFVFMSWIDQFGPCEVDEAICIAGRISKYKGFEGGRDAFAKYIYGILRNRKEVKE